MKFTGYKLVALSSLRFDIPDIRRRTKLAHVTDMAGTIRESANEVINAPLVRAESRELVCGRDRVAALTVVKAKKLWVHLVDCTDSEAAWLERLENAHRRVDNRAQLIAEMVQLRSAAIEQESAVTENEGRTVSRPSKQAITAEARKQVARAAGVSTSAVKKAEQRARKKGSGSLSSSGAEAAETPSSVRRESEASSSPDALTGPGGAAGATQEEDVQPLTLDLLGCDDASARAVMKFARPMQEAIDAADKHLRLALGALAPVEMTALGQELRPQVKRVGDLLRSKRPEFLCPWCKGLPKATLGYVCAGCGGAMHVSHEQAGRAPAEAREARPPIVLLHGKAYPYEDVRDGRAKLIFGNGTAPAKKAKRVAVQDAAGNPIPLDADEAY